MERQPPPVPLPSILELVTKSSCLNLSRLLSPQTRADDPHPPGPKDHTKQYQAYAALRTATARGSPGRPPCAAAGARIPPSAVSFSSSVMTGVLLGEVFELASLKVPFLQVIPHTWEMADLRV